MLPKAPPRASLTPLALTERGKGKTMAKIFNSKATPGREQPPEIPQPQLQEVITPGREQPPEIPAPVSIMGGMGIVIIGEESPSKGPTFH